MIKCLLLNLSKNNINSNKKMEKEILKQLQEIENRYKKMKQLFIGFVCITLVGIFSLGFTKTDKTDKFDLIRAKGIIIEDNVWLGGSVVVLDGVRIGRNSVIGAGTIVTKDVPKTVKEIEALMATV